ncbi:MAG: AgmX/PglI C-terminal domain-containing protein [Deltaproteobacteria bacterium]|nr:AgmX/PglI C-terminal domain-containing protein [Deltaproteobacteria bacterium]
MVESLPPQAPKHGSRGTLLFLMAGILVLGAAIVFVTQRDAKRAPPSPVSKPEQKFETPTPLVMSQPTRPIAANPDAGVATAPRIVSKGPGGPPMERMGTIDAKAVETFINGRFSVLRACYENRLKVNPLLQGKLDLSIGVSSQGRVTSVSAEEDHLRDPIMLQCVKSTIRGWAFPKPEGGRVVIGKTFNFKPKM